MAGIYCMETGQIQPNLEELNKRFKIQEVADLLRIKRDGKENEPLKELEEGKLDLLIRDLFDKLDKSYIKSKIPEIPCEDDIEEINRFLISLRMQT
jgi:hypothetical protein